LLINGTGRTDFQNGSSKDAYNSIFNRLLKLPDETLLYPAHDYNGEKNSTIGKEKKFNPRLQVNNVEEYIEIAKSEGGTILTGGYPDLSEEYKNGNWISPTVIADLDVKSRCSTEEIFGPVVTIHKFNTEKEAVDIANNTRYGLAGSIWTSDLEKGNRVAEEIHTGMVWINTWLHRDLRVPFGGVKDSGVGREGGRWSLGFFSEAMNICTKHD